jgi:hypothetical protein
MKNCNYLHDFIDNDIIKMNKNIKQNIEKLYKFIDNPNISIEDLLKISYVYRKKYDCLECKKLYKKYTILELIVSKTMENNNSNRKNAILFLKKEKKYNKKLEVEHNKLIKYFSNNTFADTHFKTIIPINDLKSLLKKKNLLNNTNIISNITTQFPEFYTCPIEREKNIKLTFTFNRRKKNNNDFEEKITNQNIYNLEDFNVSLSKNSDNYVNKTLKWDKIKPNYVNKKNELEIKPKTTKKNNFKLEDISNESSDIYNTLNNYFTDLEYYNNIQNMNEELKELESYYYQKDHTEYLIENRINILYKKLNNNTKDDYIEEINNINTNINDLINNSIKSFTFEFKQLEKTFDINNLITSNIIDNYKYINYLYNNSIDLIKSIESYNICLPLKNRLLYMKEKLLEFIKIIKKNFKKVMKNV